MTQTEMMLATAVTTVCSRLTPTKPTLTTTARVMPALLTSMATVSYHPKFHPSHLLSLSFVSQSICTVLKAFMFWHNRHSEREWQLPICLQRGPERYWQRRSGRPLWQLPAGAQPWSGKFRFCFSLLAWSCNYVDVTVGTVARPQIAPALMKEWNVTALRGECNASSSLFMNG